MDGASDEELMLRIATGDEPAFRLLARRYAPLALRLARRVMGSSADAEEIVQEALLRLCVNAPRWRPVASFRTWFYRVVLNLCLNRKRRAPFLPIEEASDPADPTPDAAAGIERREIDRALAAAIAELPERQRAAIALTYHEGLSNAETAAALGTSVSAVETLLVRAKRSLRQRLRPLLDVGGQQKSRRTSPPFRTPSTFPGPTSRVARSRSATRRSACLRPMAHPPLRWRRRARWMR